MGWGMTYDASTHYYYYVVPPLPCTTKPTNPLLSRFALGLSRPWDSFHFLPPKSIFVGGKGRIHFGVISALKVRDFL